MISFFRWSDMVSFLVKLKYSYSYSYLISTLRLRQVSPGEPTADCGGRDRKP